MDIRQTTVTQLRGNLSEFIDATKSGPLKVMKHSETAAYLVSRKEYEELVNKFEDVMDIVEGMQTIREILTEPENAVDAEEVFARLNL